MALASLPQRSVGQTAITVTTLGFGGGPLGGVGDYISNGDSERLIEAAWEGGIRYFDTAPLYGHGLSEKRLGRTLRQLPRNKFVLSSKVGRLLVADGDRDEKMRDHEGVGVQYDYSYAGARASLEQSLERLGLDRIDIVLCHDIDVWTHGDAQPALYEQAAEGILRALSDLRQQGVVGAFGIGVNEVDICQLVLRDFSPDCFLLAGRFTLLEQTPLDSLLPECLTRRVSIIVGGPFNSGLLAHQERRRATYDYKPVDDFRWQKAQQIRSVCESHGIDLRAAALQYPLLHPAVVSVIPGMWRMDEVRTSLELAQRPIPAALWVDLQQQGLVRAIS